MFKTLRIALAENGPSTELARKVLDVHWSKYGEKQVGNLEATHETCINFVL